MFPICCEQQNITKRCDEFECRRQTTTHTWHTNIMSNQLNLAQIDVSKFYRRYMLSKSAEKSLCKWMGSKNAMPYTYSKFLLSLCDLCNGYYVDDSHIFVRIEIHLACIRFLWNNTFALCRFLMLSTMNFSSLQLYSIALYLVSSSPILLAGHIYVWVHQLNCTCAVFLHTATFFLYQFSSKRTAGGTECTI